MNAATFALEPPPHAFAAPYSWWATAGREQFTDRACREWQSRMRFSKYAQLRSLTSGYRGLSTLDQYKHRKALEANR